MGRFLDTNILLRHLTGDDPAKGEACRALLLRVERGEEMVETSDMVVAEVVFVLQSPRHYGLSRDEVRNLVAPLIGLRGLRLPDKSLYPRTFALYCANRISFPDAFNTAYMEGRGLTEIYSYDTDFGRVEGLRRLEPEA